MEKIIFITGTDTGVGKTLAAASLLYHLRQTGIHALAMKPFCCGGRADIELIQAVQQHELTDNEVCPFYSSRPVAPLVAARKARCRIRLPDAIKSILRVKKQCELLIVEGAGGLMVPLGEGYTIADLISKLRCQVIIVSRNKLGTINHTLLTVRAAQQFSRNPLKVLLMEPELADESTRSNARILREWLAPVEVICMPFLGRSASGPRAIQNNYKKTKKVLARLLQ